MAEKEVGHADTTSELLEHVECKTMGKKLVVLSGLLPCMLLHIGWQVTNIIFTLFWMWAFQMWCWRMYLWSKCQRRTAYAKYLCYYHNIRGVREYSAWVKEWNLWMEGSKSVDRIEINQRTSSRGDNHVKTCCLYLTAESSKFCLGFWCLGRKNLDRSLVVVLVATNNNKNCRTNNKRLNRVDVGVYYDFMGVKVTPVTNKEQWI